MQKKYHITSDVKFLRKEFILVMLLFWFAASAVYFGWNNLFPAISSIVLSVGLMVFLTHCFTSQQERRLWGNQEEVQKRMIWRYMQMVRRGRQGADPLTLEQFGQCIEDSFESMLASKRDEVNWKHIVTKWLFCSGSPAMGLGQNVGRLDTLIC